MPNPDLIPVPFAQDGDKNPIPLERIISDPVNRATWLKGFPPDTRIPKEVGGEAPDGLDFNGLFNALSQAVVFLQKGNAYQFDVSMAPYPIGALVRSNDNLTTYQSTVVSNSNNPNSNMTGWRIYNGSGLIVDNLTTNDATKVASARTVKELNDSKLSKLDFDDAYKYMPIPYPKSIPPSGFLLMDGQAITQAQYPILYGLYGANLPDLRGAFIRGWDNGKGRDTGRSILSYQEDDFKSHTHNLARAENWGVGDLTDRVTTANGNGGSANAVGNTGGGETRPKNIAFNYIVKAG